MEFTRPRVPANTLEDVDFSAGCVHFIYPFSGGPFTGAFSRHTQTPAISARKICVDSCNRTIANNGKNNVVIHI